jgi:hypothetical protein
MSNNESPFINSQRSPRRWGSASFNAPAVPSGDASVEYSMLTPNPAPPSKCIWTASAMKPAQMTMSSNPSRRSWATRYSRNGRPRTSAIDFGLSATLDRRRVPSPPARMIACMSATWRHFHRPRPITGYAEAE